MKKNCRDSVRACKNLISILFFKLAACLFTDMRKSRKLLCQPVKNPTIEEAMSECSEERYAALLRKTFMPPSFRLFESLQPKLSAFIVHNAFKMYAKPFMVTYFRYSHKRQTMVASLPLRRRNFLNQTPFPPTQLRISKGTWLSLSFGHPSLSDSHCRIMARGLEWRLRK